jgi:hypothetical protein
LYKKFTDESVFVQFGSFVPTVPALADLIIARFKTIAEARDDGDKVHVLALKKKANARVNSYLAAPGNRTPYEKIRRQFASNLYFKYLKPLLAQQPAETDVARYRQWFSELNTNVSLIEQNELLTEEKPVDRVLTIWDHAGGLSKSGVNETKLVADLNKILVAPNDTVLSAAYTNTLKALLFENGHNLAPANKAGWIRWRREIQAAFNELAKSQISLRSVRSAKITNVHQRHQLRKKEEQGQEYVKALKTLHGKIEKIQEDASKKKLTSGQTAAEIAEVGKSGEVNEWGSFAANKIVAKPWFETAVSPLSDEALLKKMFEWQVISQTENQLATFFTFFGPNGETYKGAKPNSTDGEAVLDGTKRQLIGSWYADDIIVGEITEPLKPKWDEVDKFLQEASAEIHKRSGGISADILVREYLTEVRPKSLELAQKLYPAFQTGIRAEVDRIRKSIESGKAEEFEKSVADVKHLFTTEYTNLQGGLIKFDLAETIFEQELANALIPELGKLRTTVETKLSRGLSDAALEAYANTKKYAREVREKQDAIRLAVRAQEEHWGSVDPREWIESSKGKLARLHEEADEALVAQDTAEALLRDRIEVHRILRNYLYEVPVVQAALELDKEEIKNEEAEVVFFNELFLHAKEDAVKMPMALTMGQVVDDINRVAGMRARQLPVNGRSAAEFLEDVKNYCDAGMRPVLKEHFDTSYLNSVNDELKAVIPDVVGVAAVAILGTPTQFRRMSSALKIDREVSHRDNDPQAMRAMTALREAKGLEISDEDKRIQAKLEETEVHLVRPPLTASVRAAFQLGEYIAGMSKKDSPLERRSRWLRKLWEEKAGRNFANGDEKNKAFNTFLIVTFFLRRSDEKLKNYLRQEIVASDVMCANLSEKAVSLRAEVSKLPAEKDIEDRSITNKYWELVTNASQVFFTPQSHFSVLAGANNETVWFRHSPTDEINYDISRSEFTDTEKTRGLVDFNKVKAARDKESYEEQLRSIVSLSSEDRDRSYRDYAKLVGDALKEGRTLDVKPETRGEYQYEEFEKLMSLYGVFFNQITVTSRDSKGMSKGIVHEKLFDTFALNYFSLFVNYTNYRLVDGQRFVLKPVVNPTGDKKIDSTWEPETSIAEFAKASQLVRKQLLVDLGALYAAEIGRLSANRRAGSRVQPFFAEFEENRDGKRKLVLAPSDRLLQLYVNDFFMYPGKGLLDGESRPLAYDWISRFRSRTAYGLRVDTVDDVRGFEVDTKLRGVITHQAKRFTDYVKNMQTAIGVTNDKTIDAEFKELREAAAKEPNPNDRKHLWDLYPDLAAFTNDQLYRQVVGLLEVADSNSQGDLSNETYSKFAYTLYYAISHEGRALVSGSLPKGTRPPEEYLTHLMATEFMPLLNINYRNFSAWPEFLNDGHPEELVALLETRKKMLVESGALRLLSTPIANHFTENPLTNSPWVTWMPNWVPPMPLSSKRKNSYHQYPVLDPAERQLGTSLSFDEWFAKRKDPQVAARLRSAENAEEKIELWRRLDTIDNEMIGEGDIQRGNPELHDQFAVMFKDGAAPFFGDINVDPSRLAELKRRAVAKGLNPDEIENLIVTREKPLSMVRTVSEIISKFETESWSFRDISQWGDFKTEVTRAMTLAAKELGSEKVPELTTSYSDFEAWQGKPIARTDWRAAREELVAKANYYVQYLKKLRLEKKASNEEEIKELNELLTLIDDYYREEAKKIEVGKALATTEENIVKHLGTLCGQRGLSLISTESEFKKIFQTMWDENLAKTILHTDKLFTDFYEDGGYVDGQAGDNSDARRWRDDAMKRSSDFREMMGNLTTAANWFIYVTIAGSLMLRSNQAMATAVSESAAGYVIALMDQVAGVGFALTTSWEMYETFVSNEEDIDFAQSLAHTRVAPGTSGLVSDENASVFEEGRKANHDNQVSLWKNGFRIMGLVVGVQAMTPIAKWAYGGARRILAMRNPASAANLRFASTSRLLGMGEVAQPFKTVDGMEMSQAYNRIQAGYEKLLQGTRNADGSIQLGTEGVATLRAEIKAQREQLAKALGYSPTTGRPLDFVANQAPMSPGSRWYNSFEWWNVSARYRRSAGTIRATAEKRFAFLDKLDVKIAANTRAFPEEVSVLALNQSDQTLLITTLLGFKFQRPLGKKMEKLKELAQAEIDIMALHDEDVLRALLYYNYLKLNGEGVEKMEFFSPGMRRVRFDFISAKSKVEQLHQINPDARRVFDRMMVDIREVWKLHVKNLREPNNSALASEFAEDLQAGSNPTPDFIRESFNDVFNGETSVSIRQAFLKEHRRALDSLVTRNVNPMRPVEVNHYANLYLNERGLALLPESQIRIDTVRGLANWQANADSLLNVLSTQYGVGREKIIEWMLDRRNPIFKETAADIEAFSTRSAGDTLTVEYEKLTTPAQYARELREIMASGPWYPQSKLLGAIAEADYRTMANLLRRYRVTRTQIAGRGTEGAGSESEAGGGPEFPTAFDGDDEPLIDSSVPPEVWPPQFASYRKPGDSKFEDLKRAEGPKLPDAADLEYLKLPAEVRKQGANILSSYLKAGERAEGYRGDLDASRLWDFFSQNSPSSVWQYHLGKLQADGKISAEGQKVLRQSIAHLRASEILHELPVVDAGTAYATFADLYLSHPNLIYGAATSELEAKGILDIDFDRVLSTQVINEGIAAARIKNVPDALIERAANSLRRIVVGVEDVNAYQTLSDLCLAADVPPEYLAEQTLNVAIAKMKPRNNGRSIRPNEIGEMVGGLYSPKAPIGGALDTHVFSRGRLGLSSEATREEVIAKANNLARDVQQLRESTSSASARAIHDEALARIERAKEILTSPEGAYPESSGLVAKPTTDAQRESAKIAARADRVLQRELDQLGLTREEWAKREDLRLQAQRQQAIRDKHVVEQNLADEKAQTELENEARYQNEPFFKEAGRKPKVNAKVRTENGVIKEAEVDLHLYLQRGRSAASEQAADEGKGLSPISDEGEVRQLINTMRGSEIMSYLRSQSLLENEAVENVIAESLRARLLPGKNRYHKTVNEARTFAFNFQMRLDRLRGYASGIKSESDLEKPELLQRLQANTIIEKNHVHAGENKISISLAELDEHLEALETLVHFKTALLHKQTTVRDRPPEIGFEEMVIASSSVPLEVLIDMMVRGSKAVEAARIAGKSEEEVAAIKQGVEKIIHALTESGISRLTSDSKMGLSGATLINIFGPNPNPGKMPEYVLDHWNYFSRQLDARSQWAKNVDPEQAEWFERATGFFARGRQGKQFSKPVEEDALAKALPEPNSQVAGPVNYGTKTIVGRDGKPFSVDATGKPMVDARGNVVPYLAPEEKAAADGTGPHLSQVVAPNGKPIHIDKEGKAIVNNGGRLETGELPQGMIRPNSLRQNKSPSLADAMLRQKSSVLEHLEHYQLYYDRTPRPFDPESALTEAAKIAATKISGGRGVEIWKVIEGEGPGSQSFNNALSFAFRGLSREAKEWIQKGLMMQEAPRGAAEIDRVYKVLEEIAADRAASDIYTSMAYDGLVIEDEFVMNADSSPAITDPKHNLPGLAGAYRPTTIVEAKTVLRIGNLTKDSVIVQLGHGGAPAALAALTKIVRPENAFGVDIVPGPQNMPAGSIWARMNFVQGNLPAEKKLADQLTWDIAVASKERHGADMIFSFDTLKGNIGMGKQFDPQVDQATFINYWYRNLRPDGGTFLVLINRGEVSAPFYFNNPKAWTDAGFYIENWNTEMSLSEGEFALVQGLESGGREVPLPDQGKIRMYSFRKGEAKLTEYREVTGPQTQKAVELKIEEGSSSPLKKDEGGPQTSPNPK